MKKVICVCFALLMPFLIFSCKDQGLNSLEKGGSKSFATNGTNNTANLLGQPIGTQLTADDGTLLLNRVMSVSDPMRDPNWDWTQDEIDTLYITSYNEPKLIRRPYYGSGSIKPFFTGTDGTRDIWPQDGWELVLRDFGTAQYHVSAPFYILYNKHLGILRYIFFGNLVSDQITHATGTLSIKGSVQSPFFTLSDSTDQYINNYNVYEQHTISKYYQDQWNVMDFRLAGFDPDIHTKYARFIIDVDAYQHFDLNADATLSLDGTLGSGGSTHSQFLSTILSGVDLYKSISKGYKDIKTAQQNYTELLEYSEDNKNAWWSGILTAAATVGTTSWIPALGPAIGVARFIMGGGSSQNRQPKPITLAGRLSLEGELSSITDINQLEFITPGAKVDNPQQAASYNELPIYNKKPGVFNLVENPNITAEAWGYCNDPQFYTKKTNTLPQRLINRPSAALTISYEKPENDVTVNRVPPPGGGCSNFQGIIRYYISINYVKNNLVFNNNHQIKMAFTYTDKEATTFRDITDGTTTVDVMFDSYSQWQGMIFLVGGGWLNYFDQVGIRAELYPKNSSSVSPVNILKAYHPQYGPLTNYGVYN